MKLYTLNDQFITETDVEPDDFTGISLYNEGTDHQIKNWFKNGLLHRKDGPAVEYPRGYKEYWFDGKYHRLDGPAIIFGDGTKEYYIDDIGYFEEEFNLITPLLINIMKLKGLI